MLAVVFLSVHCVHSAMPKPMLAMKFTINYYQHLLEQSGWTGREYGKVWRGHIKQFGTESVSGICCFYICRCFIVAVFNISLCFTDTQLRF